MPLLRTHAHDAQDCNKLSPLSLHSFSYMCMCQGIHVHVSAQFSRSLISHEHAASLAHYMYVSRCITNLLLNQLHQLVMYGFARVYLHAPNLYHLLYNICQYTVHLHIWLSVFTVITPVTTDCCHFLAWCSGLRGSATTLSHFLSMSKILPKIVKYM